MAEGSAFVWLRQHGLDGGPFGSAPASPLWNRDYHTYVAPPDARSWSALEEASPYIFRKGAKSPSKKGALIRQLKQMPKDAVLLAEDETILRLFPPLRAAWAPEGEQLQVPITGQNARCVLFGAIDLRRGHLVLLRRSGAKAADFHALLRRLRYGYKSRAVWLLLDEGSCHTAKSSIRLAAELNITLVFLPRQVPELNPVDHLWKELKAKIAANRQFASIDESARYAEAWLYRLSRTAVLRKSGVLAHNFWLRRIVR